MECGPRGSLSAAVVPRTQGTNLGRVWDPTRGGLHTAMRWGPPGIHFLLPAPWTTSDPLAKPQDPPSGALPSPLRGGSLDPSLQAAHQEATQCPVMQKSAVWGWAGPGCHQLQGCPGPVSRAPVLSSEDYSLNSFLLVENLPFEKWRERESEHIASLKVC